MLGAIDLVLLPGRYAVWRLPAGSPLPELSREPTELIVIALTDDEVSVVAPERLAPDEDAVELGFRALGVRGPLSFDLVGVIASLSSALADAGISVFVVSTFETDYVLVRERDLMDACDVLAEAGHAIHPGDKD